MRRAVVLAALITSAPAAAGTLPMPAPVQLSLRTLVTNFEKLAPATPDITMLTTEPVERSESSGFGWREDPIRKRPKFHHGTDYRGRSGTPVVAAGAGTVILAGRQGGYGNVVYIDHGNGVVTRYGHLRRIHVKKGATVTAGEKIGQIGSTGRTTGPHLHFEVRLDGRSVDPNTALAVAEIWRESPGMGQLAAYALSPELQSQARDMQDRKNKRALERALGLANPTSGEKRPERKGAPKRDRSLM